MRIIKGRVGKSKIVEALCLAENSIILDIEGINAWSSKAYVLSIPHFINVTEDKDSSIRFNLKKSIALCIKELKEIHRSNHLFIYGYFRQDSIEMLKELLCEFPDYSFTITIHSLFQGGKADSILIEEV
jgi:hypothetical protein